MKIGIDIGGSHIAIGVIGKEGELLEKIEKRLTIVEKKNIEKAIVEIIIEKINSLKEKYRIEEIGIGMPGWTENGIVKVSGNLGIKDSNFLEAMQVLHLPIKVQNDAKCAALAEHRYGCLKSYDRSVFLTLGTGIGGAVFLENELLKVGKKPGCEFGHMVIQRDGISCHCGRKGCFERYASMKVFKNNLREALHLDEATRGEELLEIIRKNTPENKDYEIIEKVVDDYIENLSIGIENLILIFEPQVIGIGGSFVYFEDVLLERLRKRLNLEEDTKVNLAVLGNDAGIIGAVL